MFRIIIAFAFVVATGGAIAQGTAQDIAQVKLLRGDVRITRGDLEQPAKAGDWLRQSDTIVTSAKGRVGITFIDNTRMSAGPNSSLVLSTFKFDPTTHEGDFVTKLNKGTLSVSSGQLAKYSREQMKIHTPSSVLGVNGTRFLVKVED